MKRLLRFRGATAGVLLVVALLAVALWPRTVDVDVASVRRGPLVVTVDEEGETRVRDRFVLAAPVSGRVVRIDLRPGDTVRARQPVVDLRPDAPALLDDRTRAEARSAADGARAGIGRARAERERATTVLARAERELTRARDLSEGGLTARQALETLESDVAVARAALESATFAVRVAESDLARAEARVAAFHVGASKIDAGRVLRLAAPVDGVVLRRFRESESPVPAGEPLVEIGDPGRLEIVADLLSTDAVRVKSGAQAQVEGWGGPGPLSARVRRVEPSGFTKVSALGVEEQRVNVVLDFTDAHETHASLGDGYRVEVRIVVWEAPDVLTIPTAALFRQGSAWAVFVVREGRARLQTVEVGHRTPQDAELLGGLPVGAQVILHPGETITDGVRVATRP